MRINFILPMYLASPSGGFKVVYEYANRLQARGHSVCVIHPRNEAAQDSPVQTIKSRLWKYKIQLKHQPLVPWFDISPAVKLLLTPDLREQFIPDADAIVATALETAFHVNGYSGRKGRKFYLIQSYETWQGPVEKVKESWSLPLHKIVVSKWLYDIAKELGVDHQTTHISIGLDFSQFMITTPIRERRIPRVGMLAHPNAIKGTSDGLTALRIAKTQFPNLEAVVYGAEAERAVAAHWPDWPEWINYIQLPSPARLSEIYNSCRIFLHPSHLEGWGLPAAEAMACGCALVAAANGGVFEFAVDDENALIAPIKDPEALAGKLITLLRDDCLRIKLAEEGAEKIRLFTWDKAVDSFEKALMK